MASVLIFHHLGLGDHFMCHGIVREYAKRYEKVGLFSLPHNYASVSFMYRDLPNLHVIVGDNTSAKKYISEMSGKSGGDRYDEVKIIGFENIDWKGGMQLERQFYKIAGVEFDKKWDSFFVERNLAKEEGLYKQVIPERKSYVFLHEDATRNMCIERSMVDEKYMVFMPDIKLAKNAFDYCTIIEKANEIHVIDSSFMFLIDCLKYRNPNPNQKLYVHRYSRKNEEWQLPILRKNWIILNLDPNKFYFKRKLRELSYRGKVFWKRVQKKLNI